MFQWRCCSSSSFARTSDWNVTFLGFCSPRWFSGTSSMAVGTSLSDRDSIWILQIASFLYHFLSLTHFLSPLSDSLSASSFRKMERERRFQIWVVVLGAFFFSAVFLVWFCFVLFFCAVNLLFYFFGIYLSLHGWMNGLY